MSILLGLCRNIQATMAGNQTGAGGRNGEQSGSLVDRLPLEQGAAYGALAYVVGLALTFVLVQLDDGLEANNELSIVDLSGWVFYNGHFVDLISEQSQSAAGQSSTQSQTFSVIAEASTDLPELLYTVVPVVVLVGVGYALVQNVDTADVSEAVQSGATIVVGYLPLVLAGAFLFENSNSQTFGDGTGAEMTISITASPDLVPAVVIMGLVFPAVLGAVGGFLSVQSE